MSGSFDENDHRIYATPRVINWLRWSRHSETAARLPDTSVGPVPTAPTTPFSQPDPRKPP